MPTEQAAAAPDGARESVRHDKVNMNRAFVDGVLLAQAWIAPVPRGQQIVVVGREV